MRIAVRWIHGWVTPEQVAIPHIKSAFDDDGNLIEESLRERVMSVSTSVVESAKKLRR